ncbi:hypothetical protein E3V39_08150 [Gammaproteobacteria bacterium LSUCC0112]|nr:hypothetical protein E3V39_08150 [Gammaproteobacteria bacterium LSUCC0112]
MRLLHHSFIRHPAFALLLIFCLPAQALAAVLIECEQHLADAAFYGSASVSDKTEEPSPEPDCHGAINTVVSPSDSQTANNTDANGCFHCSGTCQNLKSPNLANTAQQSSIFDNNAFSRLTLNTAAGASSTPIRPPCPILPS